MAQYRKRSYNVAGQYANVSEAYDLRPLSHEIEPPLLDREPKQRIRIRKRVNKRPVYVRCKDQKQKTSISAIITVLLIFAGCLSIALSYAMTSSIRSNIIKLQNELKEKQEHNSSLRAEVAESYNLNEIEKIATTRLGMSKAKPYQIVNINVSKQSYAIRNTPVEEAKQSFSFASAVDYVKRVIWGG